MTFVLTLLISLSFGSQDSTLQGLKLSTILSKVAANNGGTKAVVIKRSVTLKEENISWDETWYISHADAMKVTAEGKSADGTPWSFSILYKGGKRTTPNTQGSSKTFPISPEFYEPLLHYRSARALTSRLIGMQVLPTWASNDGANTTDIINLERYKGGVSHVLGSNETKNTQAPPRLWIEQDSFVLRKVRLGSQVEVEFDTIKDYEEGKIKMPEQQTVFWKNSTVLLQNKSVEFTDQNKVEAQLKTQKNDVAKLPDNVNIKEFYSRFR